MLLLVTIQFAFLLAACVLLGLEVLQGASDDLSVGRTRLRAGIYLLAAIAGSALLISLADEAWLFALALVPVTLLSLLRFSMVARQWWSGWRLPVYTCALIATGIVATVPLMPSNLDRTYVLEELHIIDASVGRPDTINPEAIRTVRA